MKTARCLFVVAITCSLLVLTACQKELKYDGLIAPVFDSVTLVRSIVSTNYDRNDNFLFKTEELFNYEVKDTKMTIDLRDSSAQGVNSYSEIFSYDNNKRLVAYETTNINVFYNKINFQYKPNGNLDKTSIYLVNGEVFQNAFTYATVNNNTVITMYDTSMIGGRYTAYRPQITKYTFNSSNQLIRQLEAETGGDKTPNRWFRDTFDYKFGYDPALNTDKMTMEYSFVSNGINTPYLRDSASFKRESQGIEIGESFINLYKNLYWFSFSEYSNNSFARSMVHTIFYPFYLYQFKNPVRQLDYFYTISIPAYTTAVTGNFENTFNSNGLLTKSVYPKNFANSVGGKAVLEYGYIRMRK